MISTEPWQQSRHVMSITRKCILGETFTWRAAICAITDAERYPTKMACGDRGLIDVSTQAEAISCMQRMLRNMVVKPTSSPHWHLLDENACNIVVFGAVIKGKLPSAYANEYCVMPTFASDVPTPVRTSSGSIHFATMPYCRDMAMAVNSLVDSKRPSPPVGLYQFVYAPNGQICNSLPPAFNRIYVDSIALGHMAIPSTQLMPFEDVRTSIAYIESNLTKSHDVLANVEASVASSVLPSLASIATVSNATHRDVSIVNDSVVDSELALAVSLGVGVLTLFGVCALVLRKTRFSFYKGQYRRVPTTSAGGGQFFPSTVAMKANVP